MERSAFNNDWYFSAEWDDSLITVTRQKADEAMEKVRLPHTNCVLPFDTFDQDVYQTVSGYVRFFSVPKELQGKRVFVCFDGAAHQAEVWCNGQRVGSHHCGYTGFRLELTEHIRFGGENQLCVKLDSREVDVPPFGGVIDYLTYGGLYREVWFEVTERSCIRDVFIRGKADGTFRCTVEGDFGEDAVIKLRILDYQDHCCYPENLLKKSGRPDQLELEDLVPGVTAWSPDHPALYTAEAALIRGTDILDIRRVRFGFRTIEFKKDGLWLNGEKTLIRGLDRHQCWPYIGYAVPARPQRLDADILKYELGCNGVRTSHYPQSHHFIDRCDEIGLLVFTELPGWQHIGDEGWQAQAVNNVCEMVRQYRNHPSIILWGVRINESRDCDDFYRLTNQAAHDLDDSRPTGGVRNFRGSHLFEDVYTYNDFVHCGNNPGCEPKAAITSDPEKPYLVSEYMGHMFPTKPFDNEAHRMEHALRHARVINDIAAQGDIAGSFGWCMFDYNTHREFGSGDGVCWHGVMDMFRNPKLAAAVYASQQDKEPVLEFSSSMDIGEWPSFGLTRPVAFTNGDAVTLYRDGMFVKTFTPSPDHAALSHPPVFVDDFIGCMLETREGYDAKTAEDLKTVIYAFVNYAREPFSAEALAAKQRLNDAGIDDKRISALQNRYVTDWGEDRVVTWRLDAVKDGNVIASRTLTPGRKFRLEVKTDSTELTDRDSWDMATVRIAVLDEHGNRQPYCQRAVKLKAEGAVELIGPDCVPLAGGMTGCYVKTRGIAGAGSLELRADGMEPVRISFNVKK